MTKLYSGEGNVIDITLGGTVIAGAMVAIGHLLGVYLSGGDSGDVVPVQISGVFSLPAVTGAAFTVGESVVWDTSVDLIDDEAATEAAGDLSAGCIAMETLTAGAGDSILVKLNVGPNTIN